VGYCRDLEKRVKERFDNDIANHVITEKHRNGFYGHWRCQKGSDCNLWFDIVTIPGMLMITGDMGDYAFKRVENMIAFMRGSAMSFGYAAEKCIANDGRLTEWRDELFREALDDTFNDQKDDHEDPAAFKERLDEVRSLGSEGQHFAMQAMYESDLFDGCDMPSCKAYTYHFLWCLHAIKWFCDKVDEVVPARPPIVSPEKYLVG